ncbi:MAG: helix-turn-helix domain-containing protein [Prevotella sp.]|jgi:transcriptional regulator with XRE-family HTH domain|uniref:Helix-turn-helix domain-containing protein n=1 Tax=Segatella cerevisiae TaxID=2053716 RepID=A0ABT1BZK4_9BACT|nr:helix-turn-helix transcriptional regulator [Segatella cerevisiae]MCI1246872.1 helix-turn-helix domain-containing protein [Prevotella sp.]MCO6026521.1 helix-turn-helix domain-containing protein [Segatella cerevisiae]
MLDFYEYSVPEIVHLMGQRFKMYRVNANLTQQDIAEQAGVNIKTVNTFENGNTRNLSFGTFILLLKAVGMINNLEEVLPELPESPYIYRTEKKKIQRIRHKK